MLVVDKYCGGIIESALIISLLCVSVVLVETKVL